MDSKIFDCVKQIIETSSNIVFFGGAGVSTASGIPDFRSATGLYNQKQNSAYSPEYMLSHDFIVKHPDQFSDYVRQNLIYEEAKPNGAHKALVKLEEQGKLKAVITQNIDGLHQQAGSNNVLELHGNLTDYYCSSCKKEYTQEEFCQGSGTFFCKQCGKVVRPKVVLYGEGLDMSVYWTAVKFIQQAEILIVGGTSLVVHPAAGLINYYHGHKLVLINMEKTSADFGADYILQGDVSKILWDLVN